MGDTTNFRRGPQAGTHDSEDADRRGPLDAEREPQRGLWQWLNARAGETTAAPEQRRSDGADPASGDPRATGTHGTAGASTRLPYLDIIQRMFGRHDVSAIQARIGGAAAEASQALGAVAYAQGEQIAFASSPDLHTAAHEAAHVVQQRHGVAVTGGMDGGPGDPHEQHADAVADLVVRGESAEALLDQHAGGSSGGASGAVQRDTKRAPGPSTASSGGAPATVKSPHAKWPVLADGGKPYKIISAQDPVRFWAVSAWIRAGEGFHASGLHAVSPACAAEIITALGWVKPERVAAAAQHLVFDLHQDVTASEVAASAFNYLGLPSAQPVVSRASGDVVQVAARLAAQDAPPGTQIVPDDNMRADVIRALAAFTGLPPAADALASLRSAARFATGVAENGVMLWNIDVATGNVLFGVEETPEDSHEEPHRYARWLHRKHDDANPAAPPERAKLKLDNFYGRPLPARFRADQLATEAGQPKWLGLDVEWPTDVPSADKYEHVPMVAPGHRNRPVALAQCEWTIVADGGGPAATATTATTDVAELEHVFVLPPGQERATFTVTVKAALPAYFEAAELSTKIEVTSTDTLMKELRDAAFADLAATDETQTPETFDASGSGDDNHGLRSTGTLPASFKPTTLASPDPHAAERTAQRQRLEATKMYLAARGATPAALAVVEAELDRVRATDDALAAEREAQWQPFQIRGTYLSRDEDIPSGELVLYGTAHAALTRVVRIRDLSRRFGNDDLSFTGTGATFEAALKAAFTDAAKAYPAGLLAIEAEEVTVHSDLIDTGAVDGGTGKTIGFQLGTDSRWNRVKTKVWDPTVSAVINTAGMIAMGLFPPSAVVVAPLLAVYNSVGVVDRMNTQAARGTLTLGMAASSVGEIALNILPMAGSAKAFSKGWVLLEGANWGGQAVLMSVYARDAARTLQAGDVAQLSQMYEELQKLEADKDAPPAEVAAARRELMERAEAASTRIEEAFDEQIVHNGLYAIAGSVVHRAGTMAESERARLVDEVHAAPFAGDAPTQEHGGPTAFDPVAVATQVPGVTYKRDGMYRIAVADHPEMTVSIRRTEGPLRVVRAGDRAVIEVPSELGGPEAAKVIAEQLESLRGGRAPHEGAKAGEAGPVAPDAGATKGKDVYAENTYDADGAPHPAKLNEKRLKDALVGSKKAPPQGTKLDVSSVAGTTATLKMEVRVGGRLAEVAVHVTLKPRGKLAESQAHGSDAGPARLDLTHDAASGKWAATVEVSETMRPEDVQFAIDHELTEAAELVKRNPGGKPPEGWGRQIEAGVMKAGATTDQATAHDVAAAREVVDQWKDYKNLAKNKSPKAALRKETFDRAMEAQGLHDPSQVPAKIALLREAGAPEEMLADLKQREVERVFDEHVASLGGRASTFDMNVIEHLLFPEPKGTNGESGVRGGHHTLELTNFADAPNRFQVAEVGTPKPHGGTTYRRFEQWGWKGEAATKPQRGSAEAPGGAQFDRAKWQPIADAKTTFDDPAAFIADAEAGYAVWLKGNPGPLSDEQIAFTTPGGVTLIGYVDLRSGPNYDLRTIYPDGVWIP